MVRKVQNSLEGNRELATTSNPVSTRVVARPVDTSVTPGDTELTRLLGALSTIRPSLNQYLAKEGDNEEVAGKNDAQLGREAASDSARYQHGYMGIKGSNDAVRDVDEFKVHLESNFNPDNDDFDTVAREWVTKKSGGLTDKGYLEGYAPIMNDAITKMKVQVADQKVALVKDATNAQAMQFLQTGMEAFANRGEPVPETWLENTKKYFGESFKTSGTEFNELQFSAAKKIGDGGNFSIYEQFKRDRPDGTPGMYYIPKWKERIDAAEVASKQHFVTLSTQAEVAAKKDREKRQDSTLADTFTEALTGDYGSAMAKFKTTIKDNPGLFSASDVSEWTGKFSSLAKASNAEETDSQKTYATTLLAGIYEGKVGIKGVLAAATSEQVSYTQSRQLLDSVNTYQSQMRALAAQSDKGERAIYKSPEYTSGKEYLNGVLKSQATMTDPLGEGTAQDRQQRAEAVLEFTTRAASLEPKDVPKLRDEIADRYLKRKTDRTKEPIKQFDGRIRYDTPALAAQAYREGKLTIDQLRTHNDYFKLKAQPK
ncbi:hypothetical protein A7981_05700 [Methylovorus sp. MM2]|uniref:hypothetical protein n=1 Tax=Methylovorus sp. MM2 TaxID=1848038 RepID=UPI0007DFB32A|nr:hypothetical protein [Methylovorus sp. MM2]OAM52927.1 hypothetical protein A7981_05700 [Methylovorus sp. MM2]